MKKTAIRLAIAASSLAVVSVLAAACSGGSKKTTPTTTPVTKADGTTPANYACNHSFTDGPAQGAVNQIVNVVAQGATSSPILPGTRIALIDPATAATTGVFTVSGSTGGGILTTTGNTRIAFKNHHDPGADTYIDTYEFNRLTTGTAGQATDVLGTRVITTTVYGVFGGLLGAQPSDLAGKVAIAGAIQDCDGDSVMHATVTIAGQQTPSCNTAGHTYPCVAYFRGGVPFKKALDSDADGQFVVLAANPGTIDVAVEGLLTAGGTVEQIGDFTVQGVADTVAIGDATPMKN